MRPIAAAVFGFGVLILYWVWFDRAGDDADELPEGRDDNRSDPSLAPAVA